MLRWGRTDAGTSTTHRPLFPRPHEESWYVRQMAQQEPSKSIPDSAEPGLVSTETVRDSGGQRSVRRTTAQNTNYMVSRAAHGAKTYVTKAVTGREMLLLFAKVLTRRQNARFFARRDLRDLQLRIDFARSILIVSPRD